MPLINVAVVGPMIVLCFGQNFSVKNSKGLCESDVRFMYSTLFLIEIYLPVKLQADTSYRPLEWCFAGVPIVARHCMLAGKIARVMRD